MSHNVQSKERTALQFWPGNAVKIPKYNHYFSKSKENVVIDCSCFQLFVPQCWSNHGNIPPKRENQTGSCHFLNERARYYFFITSLLADSMGFMTLLIYISITAVEKGQRGGTSTQGSHWCTRSWHARTIRLTCFTDRSGGVTDCASDT